MSNDVKLTVGVCVIVVAIFGSAGLVSHVMIELAGVVRADLQAFRVGRLQTGGTSPVGSAPVRRW